VNAADFLTIPNQWVIKRTAEKWMVRPDEFRKNAARFGWQLWEDKGEDKSKAGGGG